MYPAYQAFGRDIRVGFARWKVYMSLQPPFLSHAIAKEATVSAVQHMTKLSRRATIDAMAWLEANGYIIVHGRDKRGARTGVTLAWAVDLPAPDQFRPCTLKNSA